MSSDIKHQVLKKKSDIKEIDCICNSCRQRYTNRANGKIGRTPKMKAEKHTFVNDKVCVLKDLTNEICHDTNFHLLTYNSHEIEECFGIPFSIQNDGTRPQHICHNHYENV